MAVCMVDEGSAREAQSQPQFQHPQLTEHAQQLQQEAQALATQIDGLEGLPVEVPPWQLFCDTCAQPTARDYSAHPKLVVEAVPQARTGVPGVSFLMVLIANQLETAVRCGGHRVCLRMHTRQL